ncbi:MAG: hypothetical protein HUJ76_00910 [Parasporobacterium sp.]|nr:hypothetical protein [Parasporobacterium sp.]
MKKSIIKTCGCILAASMIMVSGMSTFAAEGSDAAAVQQAVDACEYGVTGAKVLVPSDWEFEKYAGAYTLTSPDLGQFMAIASESYGGETIDLNDEDAMAGLLEMLGEEDADMESQNITICGQPAVWITSKSVDEDDEVITMYFVVADMAGKGLLVSYSAFGEPDDELFASVISSVTMDGCEGETDISSVYSGNIITFNPVESVSEDYRSSLNNKNIGRPDRVKK